MFTLFKNMRLGARLGLGFGLILLLMGGVAALSITNLSQISGSLGELVNDRYPKTVWANNVMANINVNARAMRNTLLVSDPEIVRKEIERIDVARREVSQNLDKLKETVNSQEGKAILARVAEAREMYVNHQNQFVQLVRDNKRDEAKAFLLSTLRDSQSRYFDAVDDIIALQGKAMAQTGESAVRQVENVTVAILFLTGGALALGVLIAFLSTRSVTRPLGGEPDYVAEVACRVASGDLTVAVDARPGDTASVVAAMKLMVDKLSAIIGDVRTAAGQLSNASEEVSATAQSMSQAASEQAASVEETSAAIEQMSASVNQNAENAKVTDGMAGKAATEAKEGGEAVQSTVDAMRQIAQKIGIVDDIAYQTNLLALNAAIEAARAGEHGKGFAVVAAEVRKLAERSQVAAQEIGELAGGSVKLAEKAGKLLDEIVPSIAKTSDLVQEIAAASNEQSSGIGQITTAMGQLNQLTQQNASASEELAATAEEMSGQAVQLQQLMEFFRLARTETRDKPAKSTPSARYPDKPALSARHGGTFVPAPRPAETYAMAPHEFEKF